MASESVSTASMDRELEYGKKYHCSILYNYHQGPSNTSNSDHRKSLSFVIKLDSVLTQKGFNNNYYYEKCNLGTNLLGMLSEMIIWSEKVVVVLTQGFISSCWHKYSDQNILTTLITSGEKRRVVLVAIGLEKEDLPADLGANPEIIVYFNDNWEKDEASWDQLVRRFSQNYHTQTVPSDARIPVEESSDRIVDDFSQLDRFQPFQEQGNLSSRGRSWNTRDMKDLEENRTISDDSQFWSDDFVQIDRSQQRTDYMSGESVVDSLTTLKQPIQQEGSLQQYNLEESSDRVVDDFSQLDRFQPVQEQGNLSSQGRSWNTRDMEELEEHRTISDDSQFWSDEFVQMDRSQQGTDYMSGESDVDSLKGMVTLIVN